MEDTAAGPESVHSRAVRAHISHAVIATYAADALEARHRAVLGERIVAHGVVVVAEDGVRAEPGRGAERAHKLSERGLPAAAGHQVARDGHEVGPDLVGPLHRAAQEV